MPIENNDMSPHEMINLISEKIMTKFTGKKYCMINCFIRSFNQICKIFRLQFSMKIDNDNYLTIKTTNKIRQIPVEVRKEVTNENEKPVIVYRIVKVTGIKNIISDIICYISSNNEDAIDSYTTEIKGKLSFGGFVEKEENLSQDGNCFVMDGGVVFGNARVYGSGIVKFMALVFGNSQISGGRVKHYAEIFGNSQISGGVVEGHKEIFGNILFQSGQFDDGIQIFGDNIITTNTQNEFFTRLLNNTYLQLIRDCYNSGNFDFIISDNSSNNCRHPMISLNGEMAGYIELPENLSRKLRLKTVSEEERYRIKHAALSNLFRVKPNDTVLQRFIKAVGMDEKKLRENYPHAYDLFFKTPNNNGIYSTVNCFIEFLNVFNEERRLNPEEWRETLENREQLQRKLDAYAKEYLKIRGKNDEQFFIDLKNNYFKLDIINDFNRFTKLLKEAARSGKLRSNNITFEPNCYIGKDVSIFVGNNLTINGGVSLTKKTKIYTETIISKSIPEKVQWLDTSKKDILFLRRRLTLNVAGISNIARNEVARLASSKYTVKKVDERGNGYIQSYSALTADSRKTLLGLPGIAELTHRHEKYVETQKRLAQKNADAYKTKVMQRLKKEEKERQRLKIEMEERQLQDNRQRLGQQRKGKQKDNKELGL